MRLCYICNEYPLCVSHYGGIGVALQQEAEWFAAAGHDVHIVCQTNEKSPGDFLAGQVGIHILTPSRVPKFGAVLNRFSASAAAGRILGDSVGVVIAADYGGPLLSKPFPQPLIVQFHGCASVNSMYRKARRASAQRWFERRTVLLGSALRAVSRYSGEQTLRALGISRRQPYVIPNPIDVHAFCPSAEEVDANRILFVGKLNEIKGAHLLPVIAAEVLPKFPKARFEAVGQDTSIKGQAFSRLLGAQIPEEFKPRFSLRGRLPREVVRKLLQTASMVLMPSLSEACPLVALETMAAGRPLVASRRGGIPEIVRDGKTGFLADPDAPKTFAPHLERLLCNRSLAHSMGAAGRKYVVEHHSPQTIYGLLQAFYLDQVTPSARSSWPRRPSSREDLPISQFK